ncbi:mono-functional DNA-alkylating methyl methanesulfonate N-term-domain-containing protein [Emericellopsis atlantica]|uniref:Mono-functional DNA-alkylating methyl methanesulfonate N-term-domain-containing protein n=1 Tax=Emericellopsis atlantica TaxID=2614577 RepID=A0A9P7ZT44_9HYPO|nr:mono-functional DNA-alkylating methyl methanesulfonate N-term-domain-containing protein [Emericellopsis atlantica]KAG9257331.1 mono-functional DNA-alkylating methyl methanesulfonate N-term-domain-containing protein [Emericellopsis atlantica]
MSLIRTNVLRNGQWVFEMVDSRDALDTSAEPGQPESMKTSTQPRCGLLSTTVFDSPNVNKILPVRLRSNKHNDIAFISDHQIIVCELQDANFTREICRYSNPYTRIRNAAVLGAYDERADEERAAVSSSLEEILGRDAASQCLPPQMLVLTLATGQVCLATIEHGREELSVCEVELPLDHTGDPYFGHYLSVDPRSEYIALSSFQGPLIVLKVKSWSVMSDEYSKTGHLSHAVDGVVMQPLHTVLDLQFLHPPKPHSTQTILLAIVSHRGRDVKHRPKFMTWDWDGATEYARVFSDPQSLIPRAQMLRGPQGQIPLMVIPLLWGHVFCALYQDYLVLVQGPSPSATMELLDFPPHAPSDRHHGKSRPLWTDWSRPFRRKEYLENSSIDVLHLLREDGLLLQMEVDIGESPMLPVFHIEEFLDVSARCLCSDVVYGNSDLLFIGGESGQGGIWEIKPRGAPELKSRLPSWTPIVDVTSTTLVTKWDAPNTSTPHSSQKQIKDRLFFASGRGKDGAIVESRYGLRARIGIEVDIGEPIRQAWIFADNGRKDDNGVWVLAALPDSTKLLYIPDQYDEILDETASGASFGCSSRTLCAGQLPSGMIVQVSEGCVTLVTGSQSSKHAFKDILKAPQVVAENGCFMNDLVAVSAQDEDGTALHVLQIDQMHVGHKSSLCVGGDVSCIALLSIGEQACVVVATSPQSGPTLSIYTLQGELVKEHTIDNGPGSLESLTSIEVLSNATGEDARLVAGTRCGNLLTLTLSVDPTLRLSCVAERVGLSSVQVFPPSDIQGGRGISFIACEDRLVRLSITSVQDDIGHCKDIVWPTNAGDLSLAAPPVHSVSVAFPPTTPASPLFLLAGGTKLYLADMESHAAPVPRVLPLSHTPTRIIYSHSWNCLVVALQTSEGIDLAFVDPDTGLTISKPIGLDKEEGTLSSFDQPGDKILALTEWVYEKDGQTFSYIAVGTAYARVAIVHVSPIRIKDASWDSPRTLEHAVRHRLKGLDGPVTSIVPDDQGFIYCAGLILCRVVLDPQTKKLRSVKTFQLQSPAVSMAITDNKLMALTQSHSLHEIDYQSRPERQDMELLRGEEMLRPGAHMIQVGASRESESWPITLVSDLNGCVYGLWTSQGSGRKDIVTLFEGTMHNSIRRFVRADCRPIWQRTSGQSQGETYGVLRTSVDGYSDIFGVSVDGCLHHFRLLSIELCRYLQLVQQLCRGSGPAQGNRSAQKHHSTGGGSPALHVNGFLLKDCLRSRRLEEVTKDSFLPFCCCLDDIEGGKYTQSFSSVAEDTRAEEYYKLGYKVLAFVLTPAV